MPNIIEISSGSDAEMEGINITNVVYHLSVSESPTSPPRATSSSPPGAISSSEPISSSPAPPSLPRPTRSSAPVSPPASPHSQIRHSAPTIDNGELLEIRSALIRRARTHSRFFDPSSINLRKHSNKT